ncbi:hypothetical protein CC80DRAFT_160454 [Byssothecium circinans]|uniref:Uncharacterized protein n=1 Tax=Byssothecium circinans TaxID=147558 RepID=A0A6A5UBY2_9PLEO|nr:hypothetical protein CC80DRAFT_160454 [Byssothecium circinans]
MSLLALRRPLCDDFLTVIFARIGSARLLHSFLAALAVPPLVSFFFTLRHRLSFFLHCTFCHSFTASFSSPFLLRLSFFVISLPSFLYRHFSTVISPPSFLHRHFSTVIFSVSAILRRPSLTVLHTLSCLSLSATSPTTPPSISTSPSCHSLLSFYRDASTAVFMGS